MDPTARLWTLSVAMLIGCYVFGSIPLTMSFSEKNMRSTSIIGAGLIVGTALSVIIPEGIHSLYGHEVTHAHSDKSDSKRLVVESDKFSSPWRNLHERLSPPTVELHSIIGISLTLGFVFMLLVDHLCGGSHSHGSTDGSNRQKSITATLGLLVHAAADGVALGAAATTPRTDIEMIVFFAIMLHKAPAAFGLSTFLLQEGFERTRIRRHLLLFSIAAPLFSVLTYHGLSQSGKEALSSMHGTGLAMLFSAGTFLYVATVHILPELLSKTTNNDGSLNPAERDAKLSRKELLFLTVGILLPVILGLYHRH